MTMPECSVHIEPLHMYCKTLHYEDLHGRGSTVIEYSVHGDILLWELDILEAEDRRKDLIEKISRIFAAGPWKLVVIWGEKRI